MHLFAISGSLRADSSNTNLLRALATLASTDTTVTLYDGLDTIPAFSPERDVDPAPYPVTVLRTQLQAADGVVICTPEYAFGMPGVLKNALDWLVSSASLYRKPVATLSASPLQSGAAHAHAGLRLTLTAHHARLTDDTALTVPLVRLKLSPEGALTDPEFTETLRRLLEALARVVREPVAW